MFDLFKKGNIRDRVIGIASMRNIRVSSCELIGNKMTIMVDWLDKVINGTADSIAMEIIKKKIASNILIVGPRLDYIKRYCIGDIIYFKMGKLDHINNKRVEDSTNCQLEHKMMHTSI